MEVFFVSSSFISIFTYVPNKMGSVKLQNNPIKTDV